MVARSHGSSFPENRPHLGAKAEAPPGEGEAFKVDNIDLGYGGEV